MHLSTGLPELKEPGTALAAAIEQRALADLVQDLAVRRAREQGWDWDQIAAALGTPRKGLRHRYAHHRAGRR